MRKLSIFTLLMILLSGCSVKELDNVSGHEDIMIKVSMPADINTKMSIGQETGGRMTQVWNTGDRIAVISRKENAAQKVAVFELHGKGGSTDGLFRHISGEVDIEGPVDVIYPVEASETGYEIPNYQIYSPGTYDPQAAVLSWHGEAGIPEEGITMTNETAVICLQYTGTADQIVSAVKVKVYSDETEYEEYAVGSYEGVSLSSTPVQFYISLPEYDKECKVIFETHLTDRSVMKIESEGKRFVAGDLYRFPPVPFVAGETPSSFAENLRPHPRLLFPAGHEAKIKLMLASTSGSFLNVIHNEIEEYSNKLLKQDPYLRPELSNVNYPRETLGRVFYLAYMYRMTGDEKYAARAEQELLAVTGHYNDWRPDHFLTTSEMTLAFAIGYDWLYDYLPESSKQTIVQEMLAKGLDMSETSYGSKYRSSTGNWNSVCSACMIASALAVFELDPTKYEAYIEKSIKDNTKAVQAFGPDGGYSEGYSYWHYGTCYQTMLFEVLKTALGYESEMTRTTPGFDKTGAFTMMMTTPTGGCFAYNDVAMDADVSSASFWLARHFNRPDWLYLDKKMIQKADFSQEDMLWRFNVCLLLNAVGLDLSTINRPAENVWYSGGEQPLFVYRSGYDSQDDVYLGIKGGYPKGSHAHMDSGSFYYERDGVVWSDDLGSDSYTLSGYWSNGQTGARWNIFRLGASGHSTLSFDDANHIVTAKASITDHFSDGRIGAVVDLTSTFADKVSKAERTVYLDGSVLNIIDDIIPSKGTVVTWNMITQAEAVMDGDGKIILTSGNRKMSLEVLSPSNAEMFILPAEGGEGNLLNPDHLRVGFTSAIASGNSYKLHITLSPIE